jgi:hypothetical protein
MALRPLNSIAGFSTGDPAIQVVQANGDVTTINFTANGFSNLGSVSNVIITGGTSGQALITDGLGNLTFGTVNTESNRAAPMPYLIPNGESYIVNENFQGLYNQTITIDGELVVDGILVEIQDSIQSEPTQVLFDTNGVATGNAGFEFQYWDGNLSVPGNLNISGDIIPGTDDVYDLGSANARWRNGYFGGNTIYLDQASISVNEEGYVVITNVLGGQFIIEGNTQSGTNEIENGTSNVLVYANGNIAFTVSGTSNVLVVSNNGATLSGNFSTTGIKTDNYYYANGSPVDFQQAAGANTQIQFNNNNDFGASANFTFNSATNELNVVGNINANLITGTLTTNAQPNITSVGILTSLQTTGNAIIGGNLTVNGNITYINVDTLQVEDPIIVVGSGPNGAPLTSNDGKDRGLLLDYYTTQPVSAFMGWDNSNSEFAFGSLVTETSDVVTITTFGNVRAQTFKGNVESNIVTVSGNLTAGNINAGNVLTANYLVSNSGCVAIGTSTIAVGSNIAGIFNTNIDSINLGLAANTVTIGSTTSDVTARGNLIANNFITTGNISANLITGTLTTAAQANITTVGTLGNLVVSGNITSNKLNSNTVSTNSLVSKRTSIPTTVLTVVDSFSVTDYRTAKYVIRSSNDDGFESLEVLLIHNNINSFVTIYGAINDGGGNTVSISTGINNGNVELRATGLAGNTVINLMGTYIPD